MDKYILPYPSTALQPHISAGIITDHLARLQTLQQALEARFAGTELAAMELDLIIATTQGDTFEQAAQYLNQRFFWDGLCSRGGGEPGGRIGERIKSDFGSLSALHEAFAQHATQLEQRDGWLWLVEQADGRLAVTSHPGIGNPLTGTSRPLLTCQWSAQLWSSEQDEQSEHGLVRFWKLVNWDVAEQKLR